MPGSWEGPPLVGRLLAQRGIKIKRPRAISSRLTTGCRPWLLPNITEVAQAILAELDNPEGAPFGLRGYDADGITGSCGPHA